MTTLYRQPGLVVDYTPSSSKVSGEMVVENDLFGVVQDAIAANELGALGIQGVYELPKAAVTIAFGEKAYYASGGPNVTNVVSTNKPIGYFVAGAASGDATAYVYIHPSSDAP